MTKKTALSIIISAVVLVIIAIFLLRSSTEKKMESLFKETKTPPDLASLAMEGTTDSTHSLPEIRLKIHKGSGKFSTDVYAEYADSTHSPDGKNKSRQLTMFMETKRANFVTPDITDRELQALLARDDIEKLDIIEAKNLTDSGFIKNTALKSLRLYGMTQLTNQSIRDLEGLEWLGLNHASQVTFEGVFALKSINHLWLWNMPHFSDKHLAVLRERGIRVFDGRLKESKNYSVPNFE